MARLVVLFVCVLMSGYVVARMKPTVDTLARQLRVLKKRSNEFDNEIDFIKSTLRDHSSLIHKRCSERPKMPVEVHNETSKIREPSVQVTVADVQDTMAEIKIAVPNEEKLSVDVAYFETGDNSTTLSSILHADLDSQSLWLSGLTPNTNYTVIVDPLHQSLQKGNTTFTTKPSGSPPSPIVEVVVNTTHTEFLIYSPRGEVGKHVTAYDIYKKEMRNIHKYTIAAERPITRFVLPLEWTQIVCFEAVVPPSTSSDSTCVMTTQHRPLSPI